MFGFGRALALFGDLEVVGVGKVEPLVLALGVPEVVALEFVSDFLFEAGKLLVYDILHALHELLLKFFVSDVDADVEHFE